MPVLRDLFGVPVLLLQMRVGAIQHDMVEREEEVQVGSIILAPGYEIYNARLSQEYGLGRYPNVVNALQFERILSASGPTMGHVTRPADGQVRAKSRSSNAWAAGTRIIPIALQCAACMPRKRPSLPKNTRRSFSRPSSLSTFAPTAKGLIPITSAAREYGIRYVRCASRVAEDPRTHNLRISYMDESGDFGKKSST